MHQRMQGEDLDTVVCAHEKMAVVSRKTTAREEVAAVDADGTEDADPMQLGTVFLANLGTSVVLIVERILIPFTVSISKKIKLFFIGNMILTISILFNFFTSNNKLSAYSKKNKEMLLGLIFIC
jgi:hypothetical protein